MYSTHTTQYNSPASALLSTGREEHSRAHHAGYATSDVPMASMKGFALPKLQKLDLTTAAEYVANYGRPV